MSLQIMKSSLEAYLRDNLIDVAIKWNNTDYYTLNNQPLSNQQIEDLDVFVEPRVVPISDNRQLMSSSTPFQTEAFFQIDIYNKLNTGTGYVFSIVDTLNSLYRESYINQVLCDWSVTINSFEIGDFEITPHRLHCTYWN